MEKEYFLGIDIGTSSVGFAATDTNYNIIKKGSKSIWGSRVFEKVNTAAERRTFRSNRRRIQRRKERIKLLQTLFSEEIHKIDKNFFERLEKSKIHIEDKNWVYTLFDDKEFNDKDFYSKYKTIYHLKKELIEDEESKFDIRLIYLALQNIIKNRGHFLFQNISDKKPPEFKQIFNKLNSYLSNKFNICFDESKYDELEIIVKENISQKEKEKKLLNLFSVNKSDEQKYMILLALSNGKFDICKLFEDESLKDDNDKNIKLKLSEIDEGTFDKLDLCAEYKETIYLLKSVYDWNILESILKNKEYISFAKVEIYEQHKEDLKILKKFVKENFEEEKYRKIFKGNTKDGYANYVGLNKKGNKKTYIKKCNEETFYKMLKSLLNKTEDKESEEFLYISKRLEEGSFLTKQVSKNNCVIPYQINLFELEKILENASKHYPFLLEEDEKNDNITVKDKIISIFKFKIPYYIGPLNENSPFSWVVKNTKEKIYPWNFEKVVNKEESGEAFIKRMTNKCSYLPSEDVLAKNSLLYSEYMVLNEINNLKINSEKIENKIKKEVFEELFLKHKKVKPKQIKDFFISKGYMEKDGEISGIDININSSMSSYIDFKWLIDKYNRDIVEDIINYIVIFGEDKKMLTSKIRKEYGDKLQEDEIKKCCSFKYSGWGRLSKKLLTEIKDINKDTGEELSIIEMLRETNNNFMELLSKRFNFESKIREENKLDKKEESILQKINNLYVSPKVKRPIYQSLLIIKEIEKTMKFPPKKIFLEMSREKIKEKQRTKKRKENLLELYKNIDEEYQDLYKQLSETEDKEFEKIKICLYYLQLGRCMYTGERIPLEYLMDASKYDRDHIYPKSKIKDDSFDNLVLVKREVNGYKTNIYPIPPKIQKDMREFWDMLKSKNLLTKEKYNRLIRKTELTEDELNVFIERQLVETRQASKAVGEILRDLYPKVEIVYVKSNLVSDFRKDKDLIKCRELNDYHHAKDAYLNIVVGNVYNTQFTDKFYIKRLKEGKVSLNEIFNYNIENVWEGEKSITDVKNIMSKNNILFTRYSDTKRGALFKQTLYPAGKSEGLFPLKKGLDTKKYGGYDDKSVSYFIIVEHTKKGKREEKRVRSIDYVYMYNRQEYEKSPEKYCEEILGLVNPKIIIKKVKINTLFSLDGLYLHISGKTADSITFKLAMQLILSYEDEKYIKNVFNLLKKGKEYFEKSEDYIIKEMKVNKEENIKLYNKLLDKMGENSKCYWAFKGNAYKNAKEGKEKFEKDFTLYEQCETLVEIIKILQCNAVTGNLYDNETGIIKSSKNSMFKKFKSVKIIHQSVTGLYEKEIDLSYNEPNSKKGK